MPHSLWGGVETPLLVGELSTQSLPFAWRFPKKGAGDAWRWWHCPFLSPRKLGQQLCACRRVYQPGLFHT